MLTCAHVGWFGFMRFGGVGCLAAALTLVERCLTGEDIWRRRNAQWDCFIEDEKKITSSRYIYYYFASNILSRIGVTLICETSRKGEHGVRYLQPFYHEYIALYSGSQRMVVERVDPASGLLCLGVLN